MSERGDSDLSLTPLAGQGEDRGSPTANTRRVPPKEAASRKLSFVDAMPQRQVRIDSFVLARDPYCLLY